MNADQELYDRVMARLGATHELELSEYDGDAHMRSRSSLVTVELEANLKAQWELFPIWRTTGSEDAPRKSHEDYACYQSLIELLKALDGEKP